MTTDVFLFLLTVVSILTGLTVEAFKHIFNELKVKYSANVLAGIVSIVLSITVGVLYTIVIDGVILSNLICYLIALVFLSWLCAMLGYDKVVQAVNQIIQIFSQMKK